MTVAFSSVETFQTVDVLHSLLAVRTHPKPCLWHLLNCNSLWCISPGELQANSAAGNTTPYVW